MLHKSKISYVLDDTFRMCTDCIYGKMTQLPFSQQSNRCLFSFEKIHSDVWGPSPIKSVEGHRYYVTFIDDCAKFVWIFPFCNKSDVFSIFVKFHAYVAVQFGSNIKTLQFDGGGEFMSKQFQNFLALKGMVHRIFYPHTPQQNGFVEKRTDT